MTDYKQLCAELVDDLELCDWPYKLKETIRADIDRARAALAEPEPEGPTDEELFAVAEAYAEDNGLIGLHNAPDFARAVLARWGNHPGSPDSSAPQPVPDPVAWMYQGEPSFDGTDWRETWEVTTDKRLAEFKATPDQPIPLFFIQLNPLSPIN